MAASGSQTEALERFVSFTGLKSQQRDNCHFLWISPLNGLHFQCLTQHLFRCGCTSGWLVGSSSSSSSWFSLSTLPTPGQRLGRLFTPEYVPQLTNVKYNHSCSGIATIKRMKARAGWPLFSPSPLACKCSWTPARLFSIMLCSFKSNHC